VELGLHRIVDATFPTILTFSTRDACTLWRCRTSKLITFLELNDLGRLLCAVAAVCVLSSMAQARTRAPAISPECNITMPCIGVGLGTDLQVESRKALRISESDSPVVRQVRRVRTSGVSDSSTGVSDSGVFDTSVSNSSISDPGVSDSGVSVSGLVSPLASKLASIEAACPGTQAISGIRHTRIAGTRRMSLHAQGKAVDVRGPYGCIYTELKGWSGGYSTDAGRVRHIHISYDDAGGREMGIRFAHGGRRHSFRNAYARMR
jgi:hypothetical protein